MLRLALIETHIKYTWLYAIARHNHPKNNFYKKKKSVCYTHSITPCGGERPLLEMGGEGPLTAHIIGLTRRPTLKQSPESDPSFETAPIKLYRTCEEHCF